MLKHLQSSQSGNTDKISQVCLCPAEAVTTPRTSSPALMCLPVQLVKLVKVLSAAPTVAGLVPAPTKESPLVGEARVRALARTSICCEPAMSSTSLMVPEKGQKGITASLIVAMSIARPAPSNSNWSNLVRLPGLLLLPPPPAG